MGPRFSSSAVINQPDITAWAASTVAPSPGRSLLERVAEAGTLNHAVRALGVDAGLAWDYLVAANNLSELPLIRPQAGDLATTSQARHLLRDALELEQAFRIFLEAPEGGAFRQFGLRQRILRRIEARTSARNQFYCRVGSVRLERVNAVVLLDLGAGDRLAAHITARSAKQLGLVAGRECHALIDPGWVEVRPWADRGRQQNCLDGRVIRCLPDPVDAEVAIELASGRIVVAGMTEAEMAEKGIRVGQRAQAVIQSSQIILAVDETELA